MWWRKESEWIEWKEEKKENLKHKEIKWKCWRKDLENAHQTLIFILAAQISTGKTHGTPEMAGVVWSETSSIDIEKL